MTTTRNPQLQPLDALVGEWTTEGTHPAIPGVVVRGEAGFEWLEGEQFLIQRSRNEHPDFPDAITIIGVLGDGLAMHFYDSRGVARIYEMSLEDGVWKLWRDEPDFSPLDFSQRFTGTFGDDGKSIAGRWEICQDGETWEHDFELTYIKTRM